MVHKQVRNINAKAGLARMRSRSQEPVDTSDIPELNLDGSGESHRVPKHSVTLRIDRDVLAYYRNQGTGYQTRMNRALRAAMAEKKNPRQRLRDLCHEMDYLVRKI